ncbi:MAG TPA: hypothetical protein VMF89_34010, partial [Polyangiales bacterium]|nr:hypothetical protein [Polyangiales bacterium]
AGIHNGGHTEPKPLPPELVAACPESEQFDRSSKNACTDVGCNSGYHLDLSPSSGWTAGAYTFELDLDGRTVSCQGAIPLKACAERTFRCDAEDVSLGESGCALPATQHGISNIAFEGFPLALTVRIVKDGNELSSTTLTPSYKAGQPNGPGCEPICCSAAGTISVPTGP